MAVWCLALQPAGVCLRKLCVPPRPGTAPALTLRTDTTRILCMSFVLARMHAWPTTMAQLACGWQRSPQPAEIHSRAPAAARGSSCAVQCSALSVHFCISSNGAATHAMANMHNNKQQHQVRCCKAAAHPRKPRTGTKGFLLSQSRSNDGSLHTSTLPLYLEVLAAVVFGQLCCGSCQILHVSLHPAALPVPEQPAPTCNGIREPNGG